MYCLYLGCVWSEHSEHWEKWVGTDLSSSSFLASPDHLIPIPVMMITIRNSESRPINCGVSKLNMAKKWASWRIDIQMQWFYDKFYEIETVENNWLFDYKQSCWKHFNPNCIFSLPIKEGKRQFLKQLFQSSTSITIILFCPEVLFYFFFIPSYCGRFSDSNTKRMSQWHQRQCWFLSCIIWCVSTMLTYL